jgi:hypothetical protein
VGFEQEIPPSVGTLNLSYNSKQFIDGKELKTSTRIPMQSCKESTGYSMSKRDKLVHMMCFDDLPVETRSLTGDYFSNEFKYL